MQRLLAFVRGLWPRSESPNDAAARLVDKGLKAGEATLDRRVLENDKLIAETQVAVNQARRASVEATVDEAAAAASLNLREAEAAQKWAEADHTRARAFKEIAEGLKILRDMGMRVEALDAEDQLRLVLKRDATRLRGDVEFSLSDENSALLKELWVDFEDLRFRLVRVDVSEKTELLRALAYTRGVQERLAALPLGRRPTLLSAAIGNGLGRVVRAMKLSRGQFEGVIMLAHEDGEISLEVSRRVRELAFRYVYDGAPFIASEDTDACAALAFWLCDRYLRKHASLAQPQVALTVESVTGAEAERRLTRRN